MSGSTSDSGRDRPAGQGSRPAPDPHRRPARSPLEGTPAGLEAWERDLDAEIEAHLAHRIDDLVAAGISEVEARAQARSEFGDAERVKAESREVRRARHRSMQRASSAQGVREDVRWALRQLRRAPGFGLTAVATLLLGIGGAVTIASVVDAVVFEPLPFRDPDAVVFADMRTPEGRPFSVAEATFLDWRREVGSFDGVAALHTVSGTLRAPGRPRAVRVARISHDLLDVLGLEPLLGRPIAEEEDGPATPSPVALLSPGTWRSDFGADPEVIGSIIDLDGTRYQVIGVMPPAVEVLTGETPPLFVPMGADPTLARDDHYLDVVARLAPGTALEDAAAELADVQDRLSRTHGADLGWTTRVRSAREVLIGTTVERAGVVLLGAALLLLVMACVNVSNLLMVRATIRRGEMALRAALGASRGRLVRQLFTESGLLALLGGTLGIVSAYLTLPVVKALGAARIPRLDEAGLDGSAVFVGLAAAAVATVACGLAPVVQLRGERLGDSIRAGRGRSGDPGRRIRSFLVAGQVALTVVLLTGTGLLLRSFVELTRVDPGFEPQRTMAFSIDMPDGSWDWQVRRELVPRLREAIASVPGVTAVGGTAVTPFSGYALANFVAPEDRLPDRAADFTPIQWRVVTPGFFEAMGMELLDGRPFRASDSYEGGAPVVIGEALARRSWDEESAVGRRLVWGDPQGSRLTVVGVVEDLRDVELGATPQPIVYRPHRQIPWAAMTMVVRFEDVDPATVVSGVRTRVSETVPGLPVGEVASLDEILSRAVAEPRFNLQLLSAFALVGLLMALVGVYGLTAFDVRRRFAEIGIRLTLGARPEGIRSMILRQRMRTTLVGLGAGLAVAWALSGMVSALLYGIEPSDPVTWLAVPAVVILASLAATYLPARKATGVDPRHVLNAE
ncbi:MAG: ABC transporter permease [Longimicrobiales bacterium]|nr:ABC transporter permease [Longimicrobiales bacterium]